jgi:hypothetical protein
MPFAHLQERSAKKMTGHEFKSGADSRPLHEFSQPLAASPFLLIANPAMAEFPAFVGAREVHHLQIDARNARRDRHEILDEAPEYLVLAMARSNVVNCLVPVFSNGPRLEIVVQPTYEVRQRTVKSSFHFRTIGR